jgi:type II secretory pathway pseudopilin PulG
MICVRSIPADLDAARRRRSAYSLIELVLALGLIAILLLGAQSAILLASKAMPDSNSPQARRVAIARVLERMSVDLSDAVSITRASASEIEFAVPDRDGDGQPETIRYTTAGNGAQLKRTYNGQSQTLIKKLDAFKLTYDTRPSPEPTTYVDGAEVLLASNDSATNLADFVVDSSHWIATSFRPLLPVDAASWTITRVKIKTRPHGPALGLSKVQARLAAADAPTAPVLDEASMVEGLLPAAYAWNEFAFSKSPRFNPGDSAAIVVQWAADTESCDVQYQSAGVASGNVALALSDSGGGAWSPDAGKAMLFYAYGRIASPTAPTFSNLLTMVRVSVQADGDTRLDTAVRIPNQPKVILP